MEVREWSEYQIPIFDTYRNENCNIAIEAAPGSGKTTVLKQLCKLTPPSLKSIFLAFNKSIVEDLKIALPDSMKVQTLHGLGMGAIVRHYGKTQLSEGKTFMVLKKLEPKWKADLIEVKNKNRYFFTLSKVYDLFRLYVLTDVGKEIIEIGDRHGIYVDPIMVKHLQVLVNTMVKINRGGKGIFKIDYIDMIYLPVAMNLTIPKYDRVFLDEAQDLNKCQHQLVFRLLGRSSRLISVGDPNQCIYSFIGADAESFQALSKRPNTVTLPLSVTYRCSTEIVKKINSVFDVVEAAPNAVRGIVRDGKFDEVEEGDMVLCRNNKPLIKGYFELILKEQKCFIKGAEFGKGLITLISPYKNLTCEHCLDLLYEKLERLESDLHKRGVSHPKYNAGYIKLSDNIFLFKAIGENYNRVSETLGLIDNIFQDDGEGTMLSTIHKAKGLEADRVFLLQPELIPSKFAVEDWEIEQEQKLLFVAYSRPKKELIFIKNYLDENE